MLNEELYTHRIQKLSFLHLFIELFRKDFSSLIRTNTAVFVRMNEKKTL